MSIIALTIPAVKTNLIGATASKKLSVIIVGITTMVSANTLSTAPKPTAKPPMQPTTKITTDIIPNLLNSDFSINFSTYMMINFKVLIQRSLKCPQLQMI